MTEFRNDITGPGIVRALQEAVAAKKDIAIVCDGDELGRVLRVGYFFKDKGIEDLAQSDITWFDSSEVQITRFEGNLWYQRIGLVYEVVFPVAFHRHRPKLGVYLSPDRETSLDGCILRFLDQQEQLPASHLSPPSRGA